MDIDRDKLSALARSLTDDQRKLLREGLSGGGDLDPETLAESLRSFDTRAMFERLADTSPLDASPLRFKKGGDVGRLPPAEDPVVLNLDRAPATVGDVARIARERTGRDLTSVSEVRVLDLDPSEADDQTLKRLTSQELTRKAATGRRLVSMGHPSLATSIDDLERFQHAETGVVAAARRVVVVIIIGPIIIIVVFPPSDPPPPSEPPLTRW